MENIFRLIGYGIIFIIDVLLYYFLHSHFTFIVMILMIVAPVISMISAIILRKCITVEVSNLNPNTQYGRQNEEAYFLIKINNPTPIVALDVKLQINVENTFFKTTGEKIIAVPVYAFKGYTLSFPIVPKLPGIVSVKVSSVKIKDLMGFRNLRKKVNVQQELVIIPEEITESLGELSGFEAGMLESEESTKRGNDFSDVQEIREYIPGDKLMSIHWKLSAKRDILMVKDRVSMSDKQLVILPELCGGDRVLLEKVIVTAYSIIVNLIKDKTTVRLMYWSSARYEYEDVRLDYVEDINEAFAKMFYEETYMGYNDGAALMASVHPELKAYVHVYGDGGKVTVMIRENG